MKTVLSLQCNIGLLFIAIIFNKNRTWTMPVVDAFRTTINIKTGLAPDKMIWFLDVWFIDGLKIVEGRSLLILYI